MAYKWIEKIGLAVVVDDHLLVVRKRGGESFILPGGKPERNENDLAALVREIDEELGCAVTEVNHEGVFTDIAAGVEDAVVVVRLYSGRLNGEFGPRSEIEQQEWVDLRRPPELPLAPSITNSILPHVRKRWRKGAYSLGRKAKKLGDRTTDDLFELI